MYCRNCGKMVPDNAAYCPECGASQVNGPGPSYYNQNYDSGSIGWAVLGFFIPLVGFILWLIWMDSKPKCARMAGIGALVSVALNVVLVVIWFIFAATIHP